MGLDVFYQDDYCTLYNDDNLNIMRQMKPNSIDSIITDPPYALKFMGKDWDKILPSKETWVECLRVAKPGAFLLAFGGTRTFHRLTCAIEDAGWEIRDCLMWLYGSGFPKSLDISKAIDKEKGVERKKGALKFRGGTQLGMINDDNWKPKDVYEDTPATPGAQVWNGYGTALKPAWEPIIVAMKPLDGTFANNALKWGVGGLNINGGRIPLNGEAQPFGSAKRVYKSNQYTEAKIYGDNKITPPQGRFPANLILDEEAAEMLDEQSGVRRGASSQNNKANGNIYRGQSFVNSKTKLEGFREWYNDTGGASRFYYCAKASKSERGKYNKHPAVKPLSLMEYLVKLTKTPTGGIVLDPFSGSGTTGLACKKQKRKCILIEKEIEYCKVASKRLIRLNKGIKNEP